MMKLPYTPLLLGGLSITSLNLLAQERPNIIFIMSDDHSAQAISCYDGHLNQTPHIDQLASQGVRFTNCFCTNAISGPSRASILTGTYNHINGQYNNYTGFDTAQSNVAKVFRANGYQTALIGKWHLQTSPSGFDYYHILPGQGAYYNPDFITNGKRQRVNGYVTDIITNDAISWMKQQQEGSPFFMMVHHKAPHRNWMPRIDQIETYWNTEFELPEDFYLPLKGDMVRESQEMMIASDMELAYDLKIIHPDSLESLEARYMGLSRMGKKDREMFMELYKKRYQDYLRVKDKGFKVLAAYKYQWYMQDYLACINAVDESVGDIMSYLEESGLAKNTIVVYTSDQGFYLGQKGWFDKRFMYDQSLQMPLIIADPRIKDKGSVRSQMVMNIDFAPTFLNYAGIVVPETMQGTSFLDQIEDSSAPGRESVYYHYFEYPGPHSVPRHYGVRTKTHKLIRFYHGADQWELYDLVKDPYERNSVYNNPEYAAIQKELKIELEKNRILYKDTISSAPPPTKQIANNAKVWRQSFRYPPSEKYLGTGDSTLHDGKIENISPLNNMGFQSWIGFEGNDFDVSWELEAETYVDSIVVRVLEAPGSWIFEPISVVVLGLTTNDTADGKLYSNYTVRKTKRASGGYVIEYSFPIGKNLNEIKVLAKNRGVCPNGHPGEGQPAWLFVEEVILK